jgi:translation elongation factor EF-G
VCGFIEPLPEDNPTRYEFANEMIGTSIPPEYYPACEKGFKEAANAGALIGAPVEVNGGWLAGIGAWPEGQVRAAVGRV